MVVGIFWVVVGGGGFILGSGWVVVGLFWVEMGGGGWWHGL